MVIPTVGCELKGTGGHLVGNAGQETPVRTRFGGGEVEIGGEELIDLLDDSAIALPMAVECCLVGRQRRLE